MRSILALVLAAVFPLVLLAWLFALSYLEDALPKDMRSARRTPDPAPILRIPVRVRPAPKPMLVRVPVLVESRPPLESVLEHPLPEQRVPERVPADPRPVEGLAGPTAPELEEPPAASLAS